MSQEIERVFRIDFYPTEWLVHTAHMTPEERGIFITIVALIYSNRGRIESDFSHIANLSNCSKRLARAIVDKLVHKDDLQIDSTGKIGQKRAESELNKKRIHLENSANGGRTKAENERRTNENNNLVSSANCKSLSTPSPSPSPIDKDHIDMGVIRISVDAIQRGKEKAPGWDIYYLENAFKGYVAKNPPRNADAAFLSWIPKFTKNKSP